MLIYYFRHVYVTIWEMDNNIRVAYLNRKNIKTCVSNYVSYRIMDEITYTMHTLSKYSYLNTSHFAQKVDLLLSSYVCHYMRNE